MSESLPLTKIEQNWLNRLEKVMQACPTGRLQCYTTGDNTLTFYDKPHADAWEAAQGGHTGMDAGELHEAAGSYLTTIYSNFNIDSCAG